MLARRIGLPYITHIGSAAVALHQQRGHTMSKQRIPGQVAEQYLPSDLFVIVNNGNVLNFGGEPVTYHSFDQAAASLRALGNKPVGTTQVVQVCDLPQ